MTAATPITLDVQLIAPDGATMPLAVTVDEVLLVGYTGRQRETVLQHIHELQQLGVAPPPKVPMVYQVAPSLLTTAVRVSVNGAETSGEVEFYVIDTPEGLVVGVGSDHTDRRQEAVDVAYSKTLCPKVVSSAVWRYEDVRDHWDQVRIRSFVTVRNRRTLYQDGLLEAFMRVEDIRDELRRAGYADSGRRVIFGGTLHTADGFVYGDRFEAELCDPVLSRTLRCAYDIEVRTT